ncbi:MAG: MFS transporter [Acidimicrobiales bacterium]|nr:MFS transporter [Acidimicrobiales bacterium]
MSAPSTLRAMTPFTAILAASASVFPAFLTGALGVQLKADLGISDVRFGFSISVFFGAAALSSVVLGRLGERLGATRAMTSGLAITLLVQLTVAGSVRTYPALLAALFVGGAANALTQTSANLFLARSVPVSQMGFALALKQSGMPSATLLGGLAVPVLAETVGWEWAYATGAALAVAALIAIAAHGPTPDRPSIERRPRQPTARPDLNTSTLLVLATGVGCAAFGASAITTFLVSSAERAGMSPGRAGLLLSLGSVLGIVSRITLGLRADRVTTAMLPKVAALLAGGALGLVMLIPQNPGWHVAAVPLAFGAGWAWPALFNAAVVLANPSAPAAATGVTQTGVYVGAVASPIILGALIDGPGYGAAWATAAAALLFGALVIAIGSTAAGDRPVVAS